MNVRAQELETFQRALEEFIKPLAERFGLIFTKIDSELYALVSPSFSFKFYCAGGHGYSFTVTVARTYTPRWSAEDERGFPWLARYVGRHTLADTRYSDLRAFAQGLADLATILPEYFQLLRTCAPSYWESFHSFVADEIARQHQSG